MGGQLLRIQDCFGGYFPLTFNLGRHINSFWRFSQASPLPPSVSSSATQVFTARSGLQPSNSGLHSSVLCVTRLHNSFPSIVMSSPSSVSLGMSAPISIKYLFLYSTVICTYVCICICIYSIVICICVMIMIFIVISIILCSDYVYDYDYDYDYVYFTMY